MVTVNNDTPALSAHRREQLARQVIEAPATEQEWSWREWKRRVDLRAFAPTIAKHILGFANRPISSAQTYADGWAYLVLGAGPQHLEGVEVVDSADLQKWIGPFLGPRGPQWDPHYVSIDDVPVLVIAVAPRRPTDPIFRARRDGRDIKDGDVFIRAGSETRRARADEQDLLDAERVSTTLPLDVGLSVTGGPLRAIDVTDQARDVWLRSELGRLLAPLESDIAPRDDGYRSIAIAEESRTPDEYRAAVAAYIEATRTVWVPRVATLAIQQRVAELRVAVENATPHNFPDV